MTTTITEEQDRARQAAAVETAQRFAALRPDAQQMLARLQGQPGAGPAISELHQALGSGNPSRLQEAINNAQQTLGFAVRIAAAATSAHARQVQQQAAGQSLLAQLAAALPAQLNDAITAARQTLEERRQELAEAETAYRALAGQPPASAADDAAHSVKVGAADYTRGIRRTRVADAERALATAEQAQRARLLNWCARRLRPGRPTTTPAWLRVRRRLTKRAVW
jgi:hypothetical protein